MKENFGVIGNIVKGSGFEDIIFQAGVCSTGSLNGVLTGSHYNRAWTMHRAFSEAIERCLFERFIDTTALLNLAEVNSATNAYKPLRPSQILQSEKFVSRIMKMLKEESTHLTSILHKNSSLS